MNGVFKEKGDRVWIGFSAGITAPAAGFLILYFAQFSDKYSLGTLLKFIIHTHTISPFLSLSLVFNLAVFFLFIWLRWDRAARGLIGAMFVYAAVIGCLKIFR